MTVPDDLDPIDLAASAALDGARGGDDSIAATPEFEARVAEFTRIRSALADVEPPDPARRRANVTAALVAATEWANDPAAAAPPAPVVTLAQRRRRGVLGPAAAVAALAAAAAGFALLGPGPDTGSGGDVAARVASVDTDQTGTATARVEAADAKQATDAPMVSSSPQIAAVPVAPATAAAAVPPVASVAELRQLLPELTPVDTPCLPAGQYGGEARGPIRWGPAQRDVIVVVERARLRLLSAEGCLEVATIPLP